MQKELIKIYEYIRGDLSNIEFTNFFFSNLNYQTFFGEDFWLEIAECNFESSNEINNLKTKLEVFSDSFNQLECNCMKIKNIDAIDMFKAGDKHFNTITKILERGNHYWWLYIGLCEKCNQHWLIAQEERINDVFNFKQITNVEYDKILKNNIWPNDFDKYINLLRIGHDFGNRVRFVSPYEGHSVYETIKEIAKEEPNIKVSEIEKLINLDKSDAIAICKRAIKEFNVNIDFENKYFTSNNCFNSTRLLSRFLQCCFHR